MGNKVQHFCDLANGDKLAAEVADLFQKWQSDRREWTDEKKEIREYLFATDTTKTTNNQLPWKNKTVTPKLTQIRDNLHANYMAALIPQSKWLAWEGADKESQKKARAIENYMLNKLRQLNFESVLSKLVLDYIDYGNAFADVYWSNETHIGEDKSLVSVYRGPMPRRISPFSLGFNVTSPDWNSATKIVRHLVSYGDLKAIVENGSMEDAGWAKGILDKMAYVRTQAFYSEPEVNKSAGMKIDGFGNVSQYLQSHMVEVLEFTGSIFDTDKQEYYHNQRIIVCDRAFVVYNAPESSWTGRAPIFHVGWRKRPDNLMAMGPLDNLVGLQYRIDHLENLKADVFDQIATPVVFERGTIDDWEWGPGARVYGSEDSDLQIIRPDATALNADMQIAQIMAVMEEMAGAPKQAMGIRTPGEKTAFEVQALENAAGRIFQAKVRQFEVDFLEPLLNAMLEMAVRHMDGSEQVKMKDPDLGVIQFKTISKSDIEAKGRLVPKGARHFSERANAVQTLTAFTASPVYQDPEVRNHISSVELARKFVSTLDLEEADELVRPNIRIAEQADAARTAQAAQSTVAQSAMVQPQLEEDEIA